MTSEYFQLIKTAHVSEKSMRLAENAKKQVVFKVQKSATKQTVKKAIEALYSVAVDSVRIVNLRGKKKSFRQKQGKRADIKKAYVTLLAGHDIDFFKAAETE